MMAQLPELANFIDAVKRQPRVVGCAESCTGGMVAQYLTAVAGSSAWFHQGYVTYSNAAKVQALGVPIETLTRFGAVSLETASAMAQGVLENNPAIHLAIATTGIAGPDGGSPLKPVGTVCFGLAIRSQATVILKAEAQLFKGNRESIRLFATRHALTLLTQGLEHV